MEILASLKETQIEKKKKKKKKKMVLALIIVFIKKNSKNQKTTNHEIHTQKLESSERALKKPRIPWSIINTCNYKTTIYQIERQTKRVYAMCL